MLCNGANPSHLSPWRIWKLNMNNEITTSRVSPASCPSKKSTTQKTESLCSWDAFPKGLTWFIPLNLWVAIQRHPVFREGCKIVEEISLWRFLPAKSTPWVIFSRVWCSWTLEQICLGFQGGLGMMEMDALNAICLVLCSLASQTLEDCSKSSQAQRSRTRGKHRALLWIFQFRAHCLWNAPLKYGLFVVSLWPWTMTGARDSEGLSLTFGTSAGWGRAPEGPRQIFSCTTRRVLTFHVSVVHPVHGRSTPDKSWILLSHYCCCCQMLLNNFCCCSCQDSADKNLWIQLIIPFLEPGKGGNTSSSLKGGKQNLKPQSLVWFNYWEAVPCPIWIKSELRE